MRRVLAHHVIYRGVDHGMSVVEFDDRGRVVSITPFTVETANTTYHPGTIDLDNPSDGIHPGR